jgi:outer membrane protein TolC
MIFLQNSLAITQGPKQLSLQEAITLALEQNPQIRQAKETVAMAGGQALQARAMPRTEISATWTGVPSGLNFSQANEREIVLGSSRKYEKKT